LQVNLSQWVYKSSEGMMQTVLLALFPGPFPAFFTYSTNNLVRIFMLVIYMDRKEGRKGFDCLLGLRTARRVKTLGNLPYLSTSEDDYHTSVECVVG